LRAHPLTPAAFATMYAAKQHEPCPPTRPGCRRKPPPPPYARGGVSHGSHDQATNSARSARRRLTRPATARPTALVRLRCSLPLMRSRPAWERGVFCLAACRRADHPYRPPRSASLLHQKSRRPSAKASLPPSQRRPKAFEARYCATGWRSSYSFVMFLPGATRDAESHARSGPCGYIRDLERLSSWLETRFLPSAT
jgi:hypothetical protein